MSVQTNPSEAVPESVNRPTETHQVPPSADDIEKIRRDIDSLKNRLPTSMKSEKELFDQFVKLIFSYHKLKGSNFSSDLAEIKQKTESLLRNLAASSRNDDTETRENQNGFKPLSPLQEKITEKLQDNAIVKSLRVSYDFLDPVELRICLLLLAIFPENVVLKKRLLIYWWIGENLVPNEEEGEKIFRKLLELGFIMPHCIDRRPTVNKCKIHPWIRYMLLSVAIKKEKLLHLDKGIPRFDPTISQRVCLIDDRTNLISKDGSETKDWRTIFNISGRFLSIDSKCFAKSKFVVLQLGRWQVYSPSHHIEVQDQSFLEGLRTQKLLKYLSLRGISRITTLPDSIKELVSLEILDLKACHNLETLPAAIASLRKLTHLDVSECYMLESMPKGLDNLTSLRVLKGFIIGNSHRTPIRIGNLQKLKNLERLSIHIGSEAVVLENEFDNLKDLEKVRCLKISWGLSNKDLIKVVTFPPLLKKLDLEGFPHEDMPEWLDPKKLNELKKLYIKGGNLRKLKGPWNVEILILKYTKELKIDEQEVHRLFPSLQYVKKVNRKEDYDTTSETSSAKDSIEFEWPSYEVASP